MINDEAIEKQADENEGDSSLTDFYAELDALDSKAAAADGIQLPASEQAQEQESDIDTAELLNGVISPLFDVLCPNWQVKDNEKLALSHAYGSLIDKYFPDGVHNKFGVEIAAVMVTVTVFGSRLGVPRVAPEEKEVNPQKAQAEKSKPKKSAVDEKPSGAELGGNNGS